MVSSWMDKPCRGETSHRITAGDGSVQAEIFKIGGYEVTVSGEGNEVTYRRRHERRSPQQTLPNMEISDGVLSIPISDFVGEILTRMEPSEIALDLMSDRDVCRAVIDALVSRYRSGGIDEAMRRYLLAGVQAAVHSEAMDRAITRLASLEVELTRRSYQLHTVQQVNNVLRSRGAVDSAGREILFSEDCGQFPPELSTMGAVWQDAREHWRKQLLELLPGPDMPPCPEELVAD